MSSRLCKHQGRWAPHRFLLHTCAHRTSGKPASWSVLYYGTRVLRWRNGRWIPVFQHLFEAQAAGGLPTEVCACRYFPCTLAAGLMCDHTLNAACILVGNLHAILCVYFWTLCCDASNSQRAEMTEICISVGVVAGLCPSDELPVVHDHCDTMVQTMLAVPR